MLLFSEEKPSTSLYAPIVKLQQQGIPDLKQDFIFSRGKFKSIFNNNMLFVFGKWDWQDLNLRPSA